MVGVGLSRQPTHFRKKSSSVNADTLSAVGLHMYAGSQSSPTGLFLKLLHPFRHILRLGAADQMRPLKCLVRKRSDEFQNQRVSDHKGMSRSSGFHLSERTAILERTFSKDIRSDKPLQKRSLESCLGKTPLFKPYCVLLFWKMFPGLIWDFYFEDKFICK